MGAYPTETVGKTLFQNVFGVEWRSGKTWSIFFARIGLGFYFLWSAYFKIQTELAGGMATKGFLANSASGPLQGFFNSLSGNWGVEVLVVYGELLIGISLLLGVLVRVGAISGALQMLLFTVALWPIADTPTANPLVDNRVILALMLVLMYFLSAGRFLGLDGIIQGTKFVNRPPRLQKTAVRLA